MRREDIDEGTIKLFNDFNYDIDIDSQTDDFIAWYRKYGSRLVNKYREIEEDRVLGMYIKSNGDNGVSRINREIRKAQEKVHSDRERKARLEKHRDFDIARYITDGAKYYSKGLEDFIEENYVREDFFAFVSYIMSTYDTLHKIKELRERIAGCSSYKKAGKSRNVILEHKKILKKQQTKDVARTLEIIIKDYSICKCAFDKALDKHNKKLIAIRSDNTKLERDIRAKENDIKYISYSKYRKVEWRLNNSKLFALIKRDYNRYLESKGAKQ